MPREEVIDLAERADVLINIAGTLRDDHFKSKIPIRVYLDVDPLFTQYWNQVYQIDMGIEGHTHYASVGLNIGQPDNQIPTCGKTWISTLPPVVLSHWSEMRMPGDGPITTVANWRGYGSVEYNGVFYGQKAHSWRRFMSLPIVTDQEFTVALAIHPEERTDLRELERNKWRIVDPKKVIRTPAEYQEFIRGSRAEIGIAKDGYVAGRSGWFSDRSACYLASGKPVIAQDTGLADHLPADEGLLLFDTLEEATECVNLVNRNYEQHSLAARRLAQEYFDSDFVLDRLLRKVEATP
jgi:hypothetical protein